MLLRVQPVLPGRGAVLLVHNWRVTRLTRLGIPRALAEAYADRRDWHQVARLV